MYSIGLWTPDLDIWIHTTVNNLECLGSNYEADLMCVYQTWKCLSFSAGCVRDPGISRLGAYNRIVNAPFCGISKTEKMASGITKSSEILQKVSCFWSLSCWGSCSLKAFVFLPFLYKMLKLQQLRNNFSIMLFLL